MSNVIYGLLHPHTKELRYVGYTNNHSKRYYQHLKPSLLKAKTHKNSWIKSLLEQHLKPEMVIIEEYECEKELPTAEIEMIAYLKSIGCDLTNGTLGGEVLPNRKGKPLSEEHKMKISIANSGSSNPNYGKRHTELIKSKMRQPRSDMAKKNMSRLRTLNMVAVGERNPNSKLTQQMSDNIRKEYQIGQSSYNDLANKYGVKKSAIAKIITGKTWKINETS